MKKWKAMMALSMALLVSPMTVMAGDTKEVTMAFCTWTGYSPMFIAQQEGYFEDAGLNMDIQVIEDESTYAALITKGSIQFLATA